MGRSYILTNSNSFETGTRKRTVGRQFAIGPNAIKFISLTIVAILAVVYLSQSTAGATRSVQIRDFESQKESLTLQKERLEAEQTRLRALKEIDNGIAKQPLEQGATVGHLSSTPNAN